MVVFYLQLVFVAYGKWAWSFYLQLKFGLVLFVYGGTSFLFTVPSVPKFGLVFCAYGSPRVGQETNCRYKLLNCK